MIKTMWTLLLLLLAGNVLAQEGFSYTPQNPKPGDVITITYEPSGTLLGTIKPIEAVYYLLGYAPGGYKMLAADDLPLTKQKKKYVGTIKTDTAAALLTLGFSADKKYDNNENNGYYILLNEEEKPRKGAYSSLAVFYQYDGQRIGWESNNEKALSALQKEMELHVSTKKELLPMYLRLLNSVKKEEGPALVQKEIETFLKGGLKTEEDYITLQNLYGVTKQPEQAKLVGELIKQKFPNGKWLVNETMNKFYPEKDPAKKLAMLRDIETKIENNEDWKPLKNNLDFFRQQYLSTYVSKKDWDGLRKAMKEIQFDNKSQMASFYNSTAWNMQEDSTELALAEELSRFATSYTKSEMTKPTTPKPSYLTTKQWETNRKNMYGMFADTYAMIMYRMGQYKKGLPYAKEAAIDIHKGADAEQNNTYALLAEKVLPAKKYKQELEDFVKAGKATADIKDILKRAYIKEKGSEAGFDDYVTALMKESMMKMMAELRKKMLDETAPSFALLDLGGNKVDIKDLKGKVVVADFWATWCGPCIASFPAMQKMVNKYKDNDKVKFVFINTWENADDKAKLAGDFIAKSKYNFHVLMDNEDKVVQQFKVDGIPTKFVIDGNGVIRFKSVGYNSSEDLMMAELDAMIDLAAQNTAKAF
ncbi:MAG: TlpA family protein disulfide reductase [Chitinophagaceae bacterium]